MQLQCMQQSTQIHKQPLSSVTHVTQLQFLRFNAQSLLSSSSPQNQQLITLKSTVQNVFKKRPLQQQQRATTKAVANGV